VYRERRYFVFSSQRIFALWANKNPFWATKNHFWQKNYNPKIAPNDGHTPFLLLFIIVTIPESGTAAPSFSK